MTQLNACKKMSLSLTFRCMCNYSFCFEVYVSMIVFVAWFDFGILGCMHNLKQTYNSVLKTVASLGGKGRHLSPGAAFSERELGLECQVTITKCQMLADTSNYDLQNVECQSLIPNCKISSKSSRFVKRTIMNLGDVLISRLCLQQPVPACGLTHGCVTMLSDSQGCELFHFVLIL